MFYILGADVRLAGVVLMARVNSGQPNGAEGIEFDAITAGCHRRNQYERRGRKHFTERLPVPCLWDS